MAQIDPADIIGKTLFALTTVPVKMQPDDSAPVFRSYAPGQAVGIVDSYLLPKLGRNKNMVWIFKNASNVNYYAEHLPGRFDLNKVQTQGVKTTEQKAQEAKEAELGWFEKSTNYLTFAGFSVMGFFLIREIVRKK